MQLVKSMSVFCFFFFKVGFLFSEMLLQFFLLKQCINNSNKGNYKELLKQEEQTKRKKQWKNNEVFCADELKSLLRGSTEF